MLIVEAILLAILILLVPAAYFSENSIVGLILFLLFPFFLLLLIIANIGILKLKENSRKLLIYTALFGIIIFYSYTLTNTINNRYYNKSFISIIIGSLFEFIPIFPIFLAAFAFIIYYFTRPRTKKEFKSWKIKQPYRPSPLNSLICNQFHSNCLCSLKNSGNRLAMATPEGRPKAKDRFLLTFYILSSSAANVPVLWKIPAIVLLWPHPKEHTTTPTTLPTA